MSPLQVDESGVEEKDIELVMQQANVTRSKVCATMTVDWWRAVHTPTFLSEADHRPYCIIAITILEEGTYSLQQSI